MAVISRIRFDWYESANDTVFVLYWYLTKLKYFLFNWEPGTGYFKPAIFQEWINNVRHFEMWILLATCSTLMIYHCRILGYNLNKLAKIWELQKELNRSNSIMKTFLTVCLEMIAYSPRSCVANSCTHVGNYWVLIRKFGLGSCI